MHKICSIIELNIKGKNLDHIIYVDDFNAIAELTNGNQKYKKHINNCERLLWSNMFSLILKIEIEVALCVQRENLGIIVSTLDSETDFRDSSPSIRTFGASLLSRTSDPSA